MADNSRKITPADVLKGESPLVLTAHLEPVAGLDRFQPAGFPEIGHVIYKAPRRDNSEESVCIVDSPASMANHLESVCMRGAHDFDLVDELEGMPYVRCVTGTLDDKGKLQRPEVVVTSLTEGHRIASTYFLKGERFSNGASVMNQVKALKADAKKLASEAHFQSTLISEFGIQLAGSSKAHPPVEKWWDVFRTIFQYDPNSLVHGVLFPQWQIKIPRFLTAHLEAFGASRVDRSGVKFDRLGKTTSGQPIFAVDEAVAQEIRATFILDVSLVQSFGRNNGDETLGLDDHQKEFLIALAMWKIQRLLATPFRFRSGCHLALNENGLKVIDDSVSIDVDIVTAIRNAGFSTEPRITDVFWLREEIYREGKADQEQSEAGDAEQEESEEDNGGED
ncbi:MAG: type I-U CRISPR-associated RAMP protein Csb1/Cas7u [Actinobacteria bacterium]|nr:type I-U CRISPR-associated RAMP protein Csb1/Cas7u [Actinomycetota bacterium]